MLLRCKSNEGRALGPTRVGERSSFGTSVHRELVIGQTYRVYAMTLVNTTLRVLIVNFFGMPSFVSLGYFTIVDPTIPEGWQFQAFDQAPIFALEVGARKPAADGLPFELCGFQGIWGYREIVESPNHHDGIINQDPRELAVFFAERDRIQGLESPQP
jgi:hypothetical protein